MIQVVVRLSKKYKQIQAGKLAAAQGVDLDMAFECQLRLGEQIGQIAAQVLAFEIAYRADPLLAPPS